MSIDGPTALFSVLPWIRTPFVFTPGTRQHLCSPTRTAWKLAYTTRTLIINRECLDVLFAVSYQLIKFLQILSTMLHRPAAIAWICVLAECEQLTHKSGPASPIHTLTTSSMHSQTD